MFINHNNFKYITPKFNVIFKNIIHRCYTNIIMNKHKIYFLMLVFPTDHFTEEKGSSVKKFNQHSTLLKDKNHETINIFHLI